MTQHEGVRLIVLEPQLPSVPRLGQYMKPKHHFQPITLADCLVSSLAESPSSCGAWILIMYTMMYTKEAHSDHTNVLVYAYDCVENYLRVWAVYDLSGLVVLEAARGVRDHQLSFWDAQIWAAARINQLPVVFSEEFNVGATLEGVRFVSPFDPAFQLADWV